MADDLVVVVVGATGLVGQDILRALSKSALPVGELRLLGGPRSNGSTLDVDGVTHRVRYAKEPDDGAFDGADLVFLACPPEIALAWGPVLAADGVAVVDCTGALFEQGPLVAPAIRPDSIESFPDRRIAVLPSPAGLALAHLVLPLAALGASGCHAHVLLPAGQLGRAGVDELTQQVVGLLHGGDGPRKVFPSGLAFDVAFDESGAGDRRIGAEAAVLSSIEARRMVVRSVLVPIFTGLVVDALIEIEDMPSEDDLDTAYGGIPTLRRVPRPPGPRRLVGKSALYIGAIEADPSGRGIRVLGTGDQLRFGVSGHAVAVATTLWSRGWVGR